MTLEFIWVSAHPVLASGGALAFIFLTQVLYNIFLHPLRSYPGPWYAKGSRLWNSYKAVRGTLPYDIRQLHDRYGDVVRIAPNELSYITKEAWQQIYVRGDQLLYKNGVKSNVFIKDPTFYSGLLADPGTLADSKGDEYDFQKRTLAPAFTRKANLGNEEMFIQYAQRLNQGLKDQCNSKPELDISMWLASVVLDVSTVFILGRDPAALENKGVKHPGVASVETALDAAVIYIQFRRLPKIFTDFVEKLLGLLAYRFRLLEKADFITLMLRERLENGYDHNDCVSYMQPKMDSDLLTQNVFALHFASYTTSSLLCGTMYYLLTHPYVYQTASNEVRNKFANLKDITVESTEDTKYLNACVKEALRMYPPVPGGLPRLVPPGGATICGRYVPENSVIGINQLAAYRSQRNFPNPDTYDPGRWLGECTGNKSGAFHPFSIGPRACVAKDLALVYSRIILTQLLWEFDFELAVTPINWDQPRAYLVTSRKPLLVKVKERQLVPGSS